MTLLSALIITCYVTTGNPTASGRMPNSNTIACHRSMMYKWYTFEVDGIKYTKYCHDTGHLGLNHFDIFFTGTLQECIKFGVKKGILIGSSKHEIAR